MKKVNINAVFAVYISLPAILYSRYLNDLCAVISAFIGGYLTARNVYEYGLFNGLATGLIYFLMLYVLSVIMTFTFAANGELFKGLLFILIASGIGGVAGINSKAQRRRRKKASYPRYR